MKEDFLFIALLRNNEKYIEYMNKMFKDIEKNNSESNFDYFFYTNNNEDKTIELLEKYNYKYYDDKEIKYKDDRLKKLAYLRQKLLESIKDTKSKYIILFDSDIFFNNNMFTEAIEIIKEKNLKVTCLNTIRYPLPIFYDWAAHKDWSKKECLKISFQTLTSNKIIETDTFFNGIMIFENNEDFKKYNYNFKEDDNFVCEHNLLNKSIKETGNKINIISNITPVYTEFVPTQTNNKKIYDFYYNLVDNKNIDIRNNLILFFFLIFVTILIFIIFCYKKYKRKK